MEKEEVDSIIDSYTNPVLFQMNDNGGFSKDEEGNLIRNYIIGG